MQKHKTLVEVLQNLDSSSSDSAIYFYDDFLELPEVLRHRNIYSKSLAYSHYFHEQGIKPRDRVIFPFSTSIETILSFFGLLILGAVPLSIKPKSVSASAEEYDSFIRVLQEKFHAEFILNESANTIQLGNLVSVKIEKLNYVSKFSDKKGTFSPPSPHDLAFVQFSSGSTAFPKGVPISHYNLMTNISIIINSVSRLDIRTAQSWLPLYHDMGLIGSLLTSIVKNTTLHLCQPSTFLMNPIGWLTFLSEFQINCTIIPNFGIDYALKYLRTLRLTEKTKWNFSQMKFIFLGSEPINVENLQEFQNLLKPYGWGDNVFKPCYGMAEAVLMITCTEPGDNLKIIQLQNGTRAISSGRICPGFQLKIYSENEIECKEGESGEIWIKGGSLVEYYFDQKNKNLNSHGFYQTGDCGFILNGNVYILGRIGDRLKVNGQSFYASQIEQTIESIDFVRTGRTAVIDIQGKIVALIELSHIKGLAQYNILRNKISGQILKQFGIKLPKEQILFIRDGQLMKTSSGKLRRRSIAERFQSGMIKETTFLRFAYDQSKRNMKRFILKFRERARI